ncbi:uncharacterized protein L203_102830 [Cryptococcus depauperatus CBS 7841]|uniref:Uncharacterized protein n=1 Tax=Cryptococcus depauperatus CBS 7841 TaxID=1295531 RepID=A0A1E3IBA6_9TREE|nr:hypothetical protein L203_04632 [Cryptococcus depauperatus CBS 7841]
MACKQLPTTVKLPAPQPLKSFLLKPQLVSKCLVSDVWRAQSLCPAGGSSSSSDNIFLLNNLPIRTVEIVGWVAGVDLKEQSMTVWVDDGDGLHVLGVNIRLKPVKAQVSQSDLEKLRKELGFPARLTTKQLSELHVLRKKQAYQQNHSLYAARWGHVQLYEKKDVQVGDTVRVKGLIEEWERKDGTVRSVVVNDNTGCISVVDPEEQLLHLEEVTKLHEQLYSRPFALPNSISLPTKDNLQPHKHHLEAHPPSDVSICTLDGSFSSTSTFKLRHPDHLPSSSLVRPTFRRYLVKHLTDETTASLLNLAEDSNERVRCALEYYFPEYKSLNEELKRKRHKNPAGGGLGSTGTPIVKKARTGGETVGSLRPYLIRDFLDTEILSILAHRIVDAEVRSEERERKQRIKARKDTSRDREIYEERRRKRKTIGSSLTDDEREKAMHSLVIWSLRNASEVGDIIQARFISRLSHDTPWGYFTLPPELIFPLLVPHFMCEKSSRSRLTMMTRDSRQMDGLTAGELVEKLKRWDPDERWVRIGSGRVEEAIAYGIGAGWLQPAGIGWWLAEPYEGP